jgi:hypothetical protein
MIKKTKLTALHDDIEELSIDQAVSVPVSVFRIS